MKDNGIIQVSIITGRGTVPENVRPEIFNSIIGQQEACHKLSFFVSSHSKATPLPTMIFTGSHGLGKSYLAGKTAESMDRELIEVNCGTVTTAPAFIEGVLFNKVLGDKPKTILMDEAHKLSDEVTTLLLSLLNPVEGNKNYLHYKHWLIEYDLSKINVIFATTDAHAIFKPLLNRCMEIYFKSYTNDDLLKIVGNYLSPLQVRGGKSDVAYACRGRARDAYILAQNIKRYLKMKNETVLSKKGWQELSAIFGINHLGLHAQEVELIRILSEHDAMSCHNLAIRMMVEEKNIESELEIRPKELGLVESTPKGRRLTVEGRRYASKFIQ